MQLTLTPTPLLPHGRRSTALASIGFLHQIEDIQVTRVDFNEQTQQFEFQIDIFLYHEPNKIPCNQHSHKMQHHKKSPSPMSRKCGKPDRRVTHTFEEFIDFRDQLLLLWQSTNQTPCTHCYDLYRYLLFGLLQPNGITRFFTSGHSKTMINARKTLLTKFMNRLVELVQQIEVSSPRSDSLDDHSKCIGTQRVPVLLDEFLH